MSEGVKRIHGDSRPLREGADDINIVYRVQGCLLPPSLSRRITESIPLLLGSCELLLEEGVLLAKFVIFILESLRDAL